MSKRLIDPIHFFDDAGAPSLLRGHLERRVAELEKDNARLERLVRSQASALQRYKTDVGDDVAH